MKRRHFNTSASRTGLVVALTFGLAGCVEMATSPMPDARRPTTPPPTQTATVLQQSELSRSMRDYYANVQRDLLRNELLRTDGGGFDAPFNALQLAENFDAIALNDEYTSVAGEFIAKTTPSALHRWDIPVRVGIEFGPTVSQVQREKDNLTVVELVQRLARATGHPISMSGAPNFHILVLNEEERRAIGPRLRQLIPGLSQGAVRSVQNMPRSSYCLVIASDPANNGAYRKAVAIIRGEHPDLLRKSCFHEELAQGLGLANDSPRARPSIFNDDEEFALLTPHDELLLKILYDKRLSIGMPPEIARPISVQIAREVMGGSI